MELDTDLMDDDDEVIEAIDELSERFVEWLTAFLAGDEVTDVHCTDCEPPA